MGLKLYAETRYTADEAAKWGDDALKKSNAVAGTKIMGLQVVLNLEQSQYMRNSITKSAGAR